MNLHLMKNARWAGLFEFAAKFQNTEVRKRLFGGSRNIIDSVSVEIGHHELRLGIEAMRNKWLTP